VFSKEKKIDSFRKKISFKYKLILHDETTLDDVFSLRVSRLTALLAGALLAVFFVALIMALILATPLGNLLPGYLDKDLRTEAVESRMRIDSLAEQAQRREIYFNNIRNILLGEEVIDSIPPMDSIRILPVDSLPTKTAREQQFAERFEEAEKYNLAVLATRQPGDGVVFHPPVRGVVTKVFDPAEPSGIDLLCARNALVSSPLDGVVALVEYTIGDGYVMVVQHDDGFLSVFKNLGAPMRKEGQAVAAGNMIGMMPRDDKADLTLHYELRRRGEALDPQQFINF
jgi:murein DD-endopeptidase MepM/ murein hydrolase activator NlpD